MPVHGDYQRLRLHSDLAEAVGIEPENIFQRPQRPAARNRRERGPLRRGQHVGKMYVDGVNIGDPDDAALRDRRDISADGIFIVVVTVSSDDGSVVADPEVILRGVAFLEEARPGRRPQGPGRRLARRRRQGRESRADLIQEDLHEAIGKFVWQRLNVGR